MKVLQINAVYRYLSTGRSTQEFDNMLLCAGWESAIAYSVGKAESSDREYLIGSNWGQKAHALLSRITGLQGYYSAGATRKLLHFMKGYKPDVVVLRNLHANYIHLPILQKYLAENDIPTVAVLHDCWFYTGKCCHYTVAGCNRWQQGCGNCPAKKKYNVSWFFDRTKKMLRDKKKGFGAIPRLGVVAVSDWLLKEAQNAPVFQNATEICRIYNWVDTTIFAPGDSPLREQLGLKDKKVILCAASIWNGNKGLHTVLRIAGKLKESEQLIMVGQVPAGTKIPPNVIYMPPTEDLNKLAQIYNAADVFMQPSLEETFGKVTAEALACGVPVVCFDSTANPELVGPGCGVVVPASDEGELLVQTRRILKEGKEKYKNNCREYAIAHFSGSKNMQQYIELFERLQKTGA